MRDGYVSCCWMGKEGLFYQLLLAGKRGTAISAVAGLEKSDGYTEAAVAGWEKRDGYISCCWLGKEGRLYPGCCCWLGKEGLFYQLLLAG